VKLHFHFSVVNSELRMACRPGILSHIPIIFVVQVFSFRSCWGS